MLRKVSFSTSLLLKGAAKREKRKLTFDSIPLHAVLVGDLPKAVLRNCGQRIVVEVVVVDLGSEVELPLSRELVV